MIAYVDSSVLLRVVLGEPGVLKAWMNIAEPISSELLRLECLRTIDRARIRLHLDDKEVARLRSEVFEAIEAFTSVRLDGMVLKRAAEPFPTLIGSLDAVHLASALLAREQISNLRFATHDAELATAAMSMGFEVLE